jgi:hypothetical protein
MSAAEVVSPADGMLVKSLPIQDGRAIQAKGISYSAESLVFGDQKSPSDFNPAWFQTVYLAPHNYHRVHSPVAGKLTAIRHIPGKLWPVNEQFVGLIPQLFTTNERLVFDIETIPDVQGLRALNGHDSKSTDAEVACPDPHCPTRFRITRIGKRVFSHAQTTAVPLPAVGGGSA